MGGARNSESTVRPSTMGSTGCGTAASARDQLASQVSSGRPVSTRMGGQLASSSLSCLAIPMPPVGVASPSRMAKSMPPIHLAYHHRTGSHFDVGQIGQIRCNRLPRARITRSRVWTLSL